jgi:CspA family cold shock protein
MASRVQTGKVKWWNEKKGWGFITPDDGEDVFVHYTGIEGAGHRDLIADSRVEFELEKDKRNRITAVKVRVI